MFFLRWIPTFLAFSLGELVASGLAEPDRNPLTALAAGAVVGGVIGAAQWLALWRLVDWRWAAVTLGATAVSGPVCMVLVGTPVSPARALVTGLIAGAAVGAAQGPLLARGWRVALAWTMTVGASWGAAWLLTGLDGSHRAIFGSNGALLATVVTGLVLRVILGPRLRRSQNEPPQATRTMDVAASIVEARREAGRKHI